MARALADRLFDTPPSTSVLVPCNVGFHWTLTVINVNKDIIYMLDSLGHRIRNDDWKHAVDMAIKMFHTVGNGKKGRSKTSWEIVKDQDDDAMLLGAQFCSDSFSSICFDDVIQGVSYSLYVRIESIGALEAQGIFGSLQRKQITLVDNGVRLKFLLWGEHVLLANLFRPFIASSAESGLESNEEFCLEYGSGTQLYVVPLIQHKEQSFVIDLRDKMTGISLYGDVMDIQSTGDPTFSLKIEDATGSVWVKLHFIGPWSIGRVGLGHTVYIFGLSCFMTKQKILELSWFENDPGASFVNISCLPALLNSSCLHKFSNLCDLSTHATHTHVCRVWLDQIEYCHVGTRLSHATCGHFVNEGCNGELKCNFCHCICNAEVAPHQPDSNQCGFYGMAYMRILIEHMPDIDDKESVQALVR
nr:uncharacterized protein LOC109169720 [Ipomoea trifida]